MRFDDQHESKQKLETIFNHFSLKAAITLLGSVAAIITIFAFFQSKSVNLCYEITSSTNVLDFNADVSKLEVFYDSTNLKQSHKNLRIFTVKIINNGNEDILKGFYDINDPVGLKINQGNIIEPPELIQTSNDYLKRNVHIIDYQKDKISFTQVILESGEYFTFKLLVLHDENTIPTINAFGKIAGQTHIQVIDMINLSRELSFWSRVFNDNLWVQIVRFFTFLLGTTVFIIITFNLYTKLDAKRTLNKREKVISDFCTGKDYNFNSKYSSIFERYKAAGASTIKGMGHLVQDEVELNRIYNEIVTKLVKLESGLSLSQSIASYNIKNLIKDRVVYRDNDKLIIDSSMKEALERFVNYLIKRKELKKL